MNKVYITWEQVFEKLQKLAGLTKIYGIPKGGMIAAGFAKHCIPVTSPSEADIIIDDIIDSGVTAKKYQRLYPNAIFYALFDKKEFKQDDWLIFPWEADHPAGEDSIQQNIVRQLQYIGEDITREGLIDTPRRVEKMWGEIYKGYSQKPEDILTVFSADGYDQIVLLKGIELYSMCEHHAVPFFGQAHVAYIPGEKIVGISKLARLVDIFAKRLQIQERIGDQVTSSLMKLLQPKGAACIIQATHMCMRMRGVEKQNSVMTTSSMKGVFLTDASAKSELMQLIQMP